jgi:DNA-binding LacI/PurR family transcriptional regulator/DNA-binding transcriptional regulator YhcF (GntR family)
MDIDLFQYLKVQRTSPISISHQISQQLTWLISIGKIKAGDRLPPIRAAAQSLGIHMHTVRAAYHHLEEMGCVSSRPGAGTSVLPYQPLTYKAESPVSAGMRVGVILPDLDAVHSQVLAGLERSLREEGYSLLLEIIGYEPISADRGLDRLIQQGVQGIVNVTTGFSLGFTSRYANIDLRMSLPIAFVNVQSPQSMCIQIDIANIAYQAAVHLTDHGHSSLGLINVPQQWNFGEAIYHGFMEGLRTRSAGTGQVFIRTVTHLDAGAGYDAALQFSRSALKPSAIFAVSDRLAAGVIQAYLEQGLRIPEDIAIRAYNDSDQTKFTPPGITAFNLHGEEIGYQAGQMMIRSLASKEAGEPENMIFPVELVKRSSCGCVAE